MAEVTTGITSDVVRGSLVCLSGGLEPLWREAAEQLAGSPPRSPQRERWGEAAQRLTLALSSLERYAHGLDPTLGRRDWTARQPSPLRLPSQRAATSA
jgi:hypothetical protein